MFALGMLGLAIFYWWLCESTGLLQLFFDATSFSAVGIPTWLLLLAAHSKDTWKQFGRLLIGRWDAGDAHADDALVSFLGNGSRAALASGAIGHILGLIQTLAFRSDLSSIGPAIALSPQHFVRYCSF